MRILYVVHQFFPEYYTGTERFVLNLAKQMQKMGHHVEVLTYGMQEDKEFVKRNGVLYKEYSYQGIPVTMVKHIEMPYDLNFSLSDNYVKSIIDEKINKSHYDIIHIAHPMRLGYVIDAAYKANIPIVLTLTDFWLMCPRFIAVTQNGELCYDPEKGSKCARDCYQNTSFDVRKRFHEVGSVLKKVRVISSPTYFLAGMFERVFNVNIRVVRHGIDYSNIIPNGRLKQDGDNIVFGYIGTVIPHKGVHVIIEAFKTLKNKNIKMNIHGSCFEEKEYYESLKAMAKGDNRINFFGPYKDEEVPQIMSDVDCIIVPSTWWENSPLTVLTSLAYRVPVITINLGGGAELVNNSINGFNFKIGDHKDLASIMEKIANDPKIINQFKKSIIRPPRNEEEAFEYEKIYWELISD